MMLSDEIKAEMNNAVLCWLATADAKGRPNVSPKEIFAASQNNSMVIADIASPHSVRNVRSNPQVRVSFFAVFRQHGHKLEGLARVVDRSQGAFEPLARELVRMAGEDFPIRSLVLVEMRRITPIRAPSMILSPERSDAMRMENAYAAYGVRPDIRAD